MPDPITIKLSSPIQVLNDTVHEITLRPPIGKDLIASGYPLRIGGASDGASGDVAANIDMPAMARLIARLGNLTTTAVEDMQAADFMRASMGIVGFLVPTED